MQKIMGSQVYSQQSNKIRNVPSSELERLKSGLYETNLLNADWIVAVVNATRDTCYTVAATRPVGGTEHDWRWMPIPRVCPNCHASLESCAAQGRYSPIMSMACTSPAFDLFIGFMVDSDNAKGAEFLNVVPECGKAGVLVGIID